MIRGKLIDWITFVLNMLVALPVFGLISCAVTIISFIFFWSFNSNYIYR